MTAPTDEPAELDIPRTNPLPLVVAIAGALVLLGGVLLLLFAGRDDTDADAFGLDDDTTAPTGEVIDGQAVPDIGFTYFDGGDGSFDDFAGQPIVLNFFAEWCAPCVDEMPELQAASEELAGEVQFLGMDTNDSIERGREIAEETGVTYTLAHDPSGDDIAVAFGVQAMPTTVFIDADGRVVRTWAGRIRADQLRQIIEQDLLAEDAVGDELE
jgi:thiol-disulfide isomerase/thioredoxin